MKIGKTLGIIALGAAVTLGTLNVCGPTPTLPHLHQDTARAEMVLDQSQLSDSVYFNEVHEPGMQAFQSETDAAGIHTMAPTKIASHLDSPSVEGRYDHDFDSHEFSARFTNSETGANFEVVCTNHGIGDGLIDGHGPVVSLDNGITLQQVGPDRISSDWVRMDSQGSSHCLVASEGMSMQHTAEMAGSVQNFAPQQVGGAYIAH